MVLGDLYVNIQKSETRSLPLTLHKTQLQLNEGPQHKGQYPDLLLIKSRRQLQF